MAIAYLMEQGVTVSREGERLIVKKGTSTFHTLHLFKLEQLLVCGNITLTPPALAALMEKGVDTVFMTQSGRYRGRLQPLYSKNITLRCEQFRKMSDPGFCLDLARSIVSGKLMNMRTNLLRLNRSRSGLNLEDQILGLRRLADATADAKDLESVRGYEGRGAVLYFDGFAKGFRVEGVEFKKRIRRPPTDPVNALLSLSYTFLFNAVMAAVSLVGFDPYLGCLHSVEYGRPSLALDLMEEWRPVIADNLVTSVINLKAITPADFVIESNVTEGGPSDPQDQSVEGDVPDAGGASGLPVRLTDVGFRKFLTQFERKMSEKVRHPGTGQQLSYRDCITEQVRHLARYVRGEEEAYQPMVTK